MSQNNFPSFLKFYTRNFVDSDFYLIHKLRNNSQVQQYHPDGIFTHEKSVKYFSELRNHYNKHRFSYLPIFEKENDEFVGICGLMFFDSTKENFVDGEVELGYALMPQYWGRALATLLAEGFVTWGFTNLPVKKIIAVCNPANLGSIKVVKKLGGEYVRDAINPRVGDVVKVYEILKTNDTLNKISLKKPSNFHY